MLDLPALSPRPLQRRSAGRYRRIPKRGTNFERGDGLQWHPDIVASCASVTRWRGVENEWLGRGSLLFDRGPSDGVMGGNAGRVPGKKERRGLGASEIIADLFLHPSGIVYSRNMIRRNFLKTIGAGAVALAVPKPSLFAAEEDKVLRVALIGCGWYGKTDLLHPDDEHAR